MRPGPDLRGPRGWLLGIGVLGVASAALTGCALQSETCVSWVAFDSPQDALRDADVAVLGTVADRDGSQSLFGVSANAWVVEVDEVLKGTVNTDTLRVVSTPQTCSGDEIYPGGDPLDVDGQVIVFIDRDEMFEVVRTLTPFDGVVAPAPDGSVPADWPPGHSFH